jgi:hypothetical protein
MHYRKLIKTHLSKIAEVCNRRPPPGVETLCAFDQERDLYLLLSTGWTQHRRERGVILFVRIRDDKIWIEEDWTEDGIANELVRAGVPKQDIVLAFQPPEMRPHTEFAVA